MKNLLNKYSFFTAIVFLFILSACSATKNTQADKNTGGKNTAITKIPVTKGNAGIDSSAVERGYIDGCKFVAIGDYDNAITTFNGILKLDPNNAPTLYQLSKIFFGYGQLADAQEYIKAAIKIESENIYYQLLYADILSYGSSFDLAAEVYENILKKNNSNDEIYYRLAYSYEKAGDLKSAINTMQRLAQLQGENESVLFELQRLYAMNHEGDKAIETLIKLTALDPYNSTYMRYLSEYYELSGQAELAQKTFDQLLLTDSNNIDLQFRKASLLKKAGDENGYFHTMHKAFANSYGNIDTKIFYLVLFVDSLDKPNFKQRDSVLQWTKLLVEAHPEDAKAFAMRGDFLFYSDQLKEAADQYNKSLDLRSDIYDVWIKMFYIYSDLHLYDSLLSVTNDALELYPNQPLGYYFNGIALNNLGEYEKAIVVIKRALPLTASNLQLRADLYSELADTYHDLKNYSESDKAFENSLQINPDNPYTLNNYAYYLSVRNENLDKAAKMSARSIELIPNNPSLEDTYGWILYKQKKYKDAKEWLEKSLKNSKEESGIILEHYGDILFQMGDKAKAVEYWKKAKKAGDTTDLIDKKINDETLYE